MAENYRLGSLQLGTAFDAPIKVARVPQDLNKSTQSYLAMIDGADKAPHRLARLVRPASLLGVRIDRTEATVSVAMNFLNDDLASLMWGDHLERNNPHRTPLAKDEEPVAPDVSTKHRLLTISAQGIAVASTVLSLRPEDGGESRQRVAFEIPADQIDDLGLLMIGVDSGAPVEWGGDRQLRDGSVGIAVINLLLSDLAKKPVRPEVAAGHVDELGALVHAETGYFSVNPGAGRPAYDVLVGMRGLGGDRLRGRRARVKHPARAAREFAQANRFDLTGTIRVEVRDLEGAVIFDGEVSDGRVPIPAGAGPVLVRPTRRGRDGQPLDVDWWAKTSG